MTDQIDIDELTLDPTNARKRSDKASDTLKQSLEQFGAARSVVMGADGVILAGNGTVTAAKGAGIAKARIIESDGDELIVVKRTDLAGEDAKAYAIADNRTGELAEWDLDVLGEQLESLTEFDASDLGFDADDLAELFPEPEPELTGDDGVNATDTRAMELQEQWGTAEGQLWVIEGKQKHRLLCGDSTKVPDVQRLFGDERAGLMNTDPPYGVAYANADRPNPGVENDELQDEKLQAFLMEAFSCAVEHAIVENAAWYMWHAHLTQGYFAAAAAAAAANVVLHRQIIWVKPVLLLGRGQYHWKHEPCFMGWVQGKQPPDYGEGQGERTQTTVWEVDGVSSTERKQLGHSTPKPVELFQVPIVKHLRQGEIAYEPFSGSGPQFVAAEQLNRRCFGLELAPHFVAVILQRMTDAGCQCRLAEDAPAEK